MSSRNDKGLKSIRDLPVSQQKVLLVLFGLKKVTFTTSEIAGKVGEATTGRSIGGVLGSLYRNGYLDKIAGGRDKTWTLAKEVVENKDGLKDSLREVKAYWS